MSKSAALPAAYVFLRILIVLNWFFGVCIATLLTFTFVNEPWTMRALGVTGMPDAVRVMWAMRGVAALGVLAVPLNYMILKRLLAMVETVRAGDPFVATPRQAEQHGGQRDPPDDDARRRGVCESQR